MRKILVIISLACICFFSISSLAFSAVDITLFLTGIDGESMIDGHEDEIDVLSLSSIISNPNNSIVDRGRGEPVIIEPLLITKYVDEASPYLFLAVLNGVVIQEAILTVRKAGENPVDYLIIKMSNVRIKDLSNDGEGGADRLTEKVTLVFSNICYAYTPQKDDGSPDATITKCWNVETNREIDPF